MSFREREQKRRDSDPSAACVVAAEDGVLELLLDAHPGGAVVRLLVPHLQPRTIDSNRAVSTAPTPRRPNQRRGRRVR